MVKRFRLLSFAFIILFPWLACANQAPNGQGLSPEEKFWFETINAMNEEEQAQLWNVIVDEVQKEASKLPEAERDKFLNEFWSEVNSEAVKLEEKLQHTEQEEVEKPAEQPIEPTKPKEPAKPTPQVTSKIDQALKTIDAILMRLESFNRKTQIIPEMSVKVKDWGTKGELKGLPAGGSWNSLHSNLEALITKLHSLKDRDPKNNEYKHLANLIKSEGVINNLNQFSAMLSTHEPRIETPELGAVTLSASSKKALQEALNGIIEALYRMNLSSAIDQIIAQYQARAQELQKEREGAIKSAEAATKPIKVQPVVTAGKRPEPLAGAPRTKAKDFDFEDENFWSPSYDRNGGYERPEYKSSGPVNLGSEIKGGTIKGGGTPPPAVPLKGEEKPGKEGEKKLDVKRDEKKEDEKKDESTKALDKRIDDIEIVLDDISAGLELHVANIELHLTGFGSADAQLASKTLPDVLTQIIKGIEKIRAFNVSMGTKKLTDAQKKKYKESLVKLLKPLESKFNKISNVIDTLKVKEDTLSKDKQYAFFGGKVEPENKDLKKSIPNPISLYDISERLKELIKRIKEL